MFWDLLEVNQASDNETKPAHRFMARFNGAISLFFELDDNKQIILSFSFNYRIQLIVHHFERKLRSQHGFHLCIKRIIIFRTIKWILKFELIPKFRLFYISKLKHIRIRIIERCKTHSRLMLQSRRKWCRLYHRRRCCAAQFRNLIEFWIIKFIYSMPMRMKNFITRIQNAFNSVDRKVNEKRANI